MFFMFPKFLNPFFLHINLLNVFFEFDPFHFYVKDHNTKGFLTA